MAAAALCATSRPAFSQLLRAPQASGAPLNQDWASFEQRFVAADGRVIDTGNGGISHSEGQGVGMLSAAMFGDQTTFERIQLWTKTQLQRPSDSLHSWRYRPGDANPVSDTNNATDGDLLISLALLTASDRWNVSAYREAGLAIGRDVLSGLVRQVGQHVVLLPGVEGFVKPAGVVVNPSYYIFPALRRLAAELPDPRWERIWSDGLDLFRAARFGQAGLPPDWLAIDHDGQGIAIAQSWPARCSFDAVRLPLYMCWAGLQQEPVVTSMATYWDKSGGAAAPAWTDLKSGAVSPYKLTTGMDAIRRYVTARRAGETGAAELPSVSAASDYYAAALVMLVHAAGASTAET
jgi:endoglucanase